VLDMSLIHLLHHNKHGAVSLIADNSLAGLPNKLRPPTGVEGRMIQRQIILTEVINGQSLVAIHSGITKAYEMLYYIHPRFLCVIS